MVIDTTRFNNAFLLQTKLKINHVLVALWVANKIDADINTCFVDGERCYVHDGDIYADMLCDLYFLDVQRNTLSKTIIRRLHDNDIICREREHGTGCGSLIGFRLGANYQNLFKTHTNATNAVKHTTNDAQTGQDCPKAHGTKAKADTDSIHGITTTIDINGQDFDQAKAATIHNKKNGGALWE